MKIKTLNWAAIAFVSAATLTFTSCSSTPKGGSEPTVTTQEGVPGGTMVETYTTKASVQAIDAATREVTMVTSEGKTSKIIAGPKVKNFNQIQIGDQITATVTKTVDVSLLEPGETRGASQSSVSGSASEGTKPSATRSDTAEATARIEALDAKDRKVTLRFSDGTAETFDVRKDIDMSKAHLGQEILIRSTEAVAVRVEKP